MTTATAAKPAAKTAAKPRAAKSASIVMNRLTDHRNVTRFTSLDPDAFVNDIYVRHESLEALSNPESIVVTIAPAPAAGA